MAIKEKANEFFSLIGFEGNIVESIDNFIEGKIDTIELGKNDKVDINLLNSHEKNFMLGYIRLIFSDNSIETKKLHIKLMLEVFGGNILNIISSFIDYYSAETIKQFIEFEIPDLYIIKWCLNCINSENFKGNYFFDDYFKALYEKEEELFEDTFNSEEGYRKLYLAAFLVSKDTEKDKKKIVWMENELKKSILNVFEGCEVRDKDFDSVFVKYIIKKFLDGIIMINDAMIKEIFSGIDRNTIDIKNLGFYLGITYKCMKKSELCGSIIKLFMLYDYNLSYTCFYEMFYEDDSTEESLNNVLFLMQNIISYLELPKDEFVSWFVNRLARVDYSNSYLELISKKLETNENVLIKAMENSDELGVAYLNSFILNSKIKTIEDMYIGIFEDMCKELNIPDAIMNDYLLFIKGQIDFSYIYFSIDDLKDISYNFISEYIEKLSGMYWLKEISGMFSRCIRFFGEAKQIEIICHITRFNIYNADYDDIANFIDMLRATQISNNNILWIIISSAMSNYSKDWYNYFIDFIKENEKIVVDYTFFCDEEIKIYLLEELFKFNREKYTYLLIRQIKTSSFNIRENIVELLGNYRDSFEVIKSLLFVSDSVLREVTVNIFSYWNDDEALEKLNEAYEFETNESIKKLIKAILNERKC